MGRLDVVVKSVVTLLGGAFGYLWGEWSILLQVLFVFVVLDYLTGLLASGSEGKLSSKVGFKGIAKKIMILVLVSVAHLVDKVTGQGNIVMDGAIFFYLANELLSILENGGRMGVPIPTALKNTVQILKGNGDK